MLDIVQSATCKVIVTNTATITREQLLTVLGLPADARVSNAQHQGVDKLLIEWTETLVEKVPAPQRPSRTSTVSTVC